MDTQDHGQSALVVDSKAGNRHRTEHGHLVLPAVLRNIKGLWEKLQIEKEDEASRSLMVMFPGTGRLPSDQRRNLCFL